MSENWSKSFSLYLSNSTGETPVLFHREVLITSEKSLEKACQKDHTATKLKDNYRKDDNFISVGCIMVDFDNDGEFNGKRGINVDPIQNDWLTPEKLSQRFKEVAFYVVSSRNNGKVKHPGEPGERSPRPRYHVYFPLRSRLLDKGKLSSVKQLISVVCPEVDSNATDATRFFYGHNTPSARFFDGQIDIMEFFTLHPEIETKAKESTKEEPERLNRPNNYTQGEFDEQFKQENIDLILNAIPADCSEKEWSSVCHVLKREGFPFELFDQWSATGAKYSQKDGGGRTGQRATLYKWNHKRVNYSNNIGFGYLYKLALNYDPSVRDRIIKTGEFAQKKQANRQQKQSEEHKEVKEELTEQKATEESRKAGKSNPPQVITNTKQKATESQEGITVYTVPPASANEKNNHSPADILKHISPLSTRNITVDTLPEKRYLFKPYFPMGKFSIISADPGTGKTKVVDAISALVTTGKDLCGIQCNKPGNVVIFSMEDDDIDHTATIAHCGGDLSKVICIKSDDEATDYFAHKQLTFGSPEIEEVIKAYKPSLVVFDPYQKWVGGKTDTDKANKLSVALTPLTTLSRKYDCHIIVIAHNIKAQTSKMQYKFMGSVDFVGESRSSMIVVKDPDKARHDENILIHVKSNNKMGKSIRYKIESIPGKEDYATVKWLGIEDYTEKDYMLADRSALQEKLKAQTEIKDDDPTVSMILNMIRENPDLKEIRVSNYDFSQCYTMSTGQYLKTQVSKEVARVQTYLEEKHAISVMVSDSRTLMSFKLKGKTVNPHTAQSRCVRILKGVSYDPGQQTELESL